MSWTGKETPKKVGLFGGTFNPIHNGHLRAAIEVAEGFELDRVLLIPVAAPPHKSWGGLAVAADRLRMIELAVKGEARVAASDGEIRRGGRSYTIDTVRYFRSGLPAATQLFLIVGLDAFLEIDTWKSFRKLLALAPLIVISRPAPANRWGASERDAVQNFMRSSVSDQSRFSEETSSFSAPRVRGVTLFPVTALDISSRRIRELAAAGRSVRGLVPDSVRRYIKTKGLYR
jgi:nicotinate-nucleotide adenylyltransferase